MTGEPVRRGLLDTNIMILRSRIAPQELPDEMAISAVTLAELSAGPHEVRPDTEQDVYFEAAERARRLDPAFAHGISLGEPAGSADVDVEEVQ